LLSRILFLTLASAQHSTINGKWKNLLDLANTNEIFWFLTNYGKGTPKKEDVPLINNMQPRSDQQDVLHKMKLTLLHRSSFAFTEIDSHQLNLL
jgi:hypothetical protein